MYKVGDELYLRNYAHEGPVKITSVGSHFNVISDIYYVKPIENDIEMAVEGCNLHEITAIGALCSWE
jgi:hypothetical protein